MADIDLTFVELVNEEGTHEVEVSEKKVIDKKGIEPQFTEGVKKFYVDMGKNMPEDELRAFLSETNIDYIFDELSRRFKALNKTWEDMRAIFYNTEPTYVTPEHVEELREDFKRAEALKERFKEIVNA